MRLTKELRKEKLLQVAAELFIEKGYHQTTTKEISKAAGITEPVIYRHFSSKHELFFEVIYKIAGQAIDDFDFNEEMEFDIFLEKFIYMHMENINKHFKSIKFLFAQILQDEKIKKYYLQNFLPKMFNLFSPYLKNINKKKLNSYSVSFNFLTLGGILMAFELAEGLFGFNPEGLSREEMSKRLAKVYLRAITEDEVV